MVELSSILADYKDYLDVNTSLAESSKKQYYSVVRIFILDTGLSFKLNDINRFISESNKDKHCYYYKFALKKFLESIGKHNLAEKLVPVKDKPRAKQFPFIPKEKVYKMFNAIVPKYRKIAFLQYWTGGRIREILGMKVEDINWDLDDELIYINVYQYAKRSKTRQLRLHKKNERYLTKWIDGKHWGFIFLDKDLNGEAQNLIDKEIENTIRYYNKELQRVGKIFDVSGFSSHYVRHLYSDNYLKAGGNPVYLSKLLGHSKIDTTMKYVSIADKEADKVLKDMEA
jgi:integrase